MDAEELAEIRAEFEELMTDTCVISNPGTATRDAYNTQIEGTPTTTSSKCSISKALDGKKSEGVYDERIRGHRAWRVIFPFGTAVNRQSTLTVTTAAGGTYKLQVLETRGKHTRAFYVEAKCAEEVKAPAST